MKFTFPRDGKSLAAADHVLIVAAKDCFGPRARVTAVLTKTVGNELAELAGRLGGATAPGLLGTVATSLHKKGRVSVGVLTDETSRHNTPARAEAIRRVTAGASLDKNDKNAVLLVLDDAAHVLPAVSAIARALPTFSQKSGKATANKSGGTLAIAAMLRSGKALPISSEIQDLASTARQAAHLVDTPPTDLDPAALAAAARRMLRGIRGVKVQEIIGDALLTKKLGGIHAVGRCARSAPRMLIATFAGSKITGSRAAGSTAAGSKSGSTKKGRHIALVGKGVTYDTGGLHIKMRGAMETMKADMGGSAAVLGAFAALARHGAPCRVSLVMCLAENAIGPAAYKPDDILTMHSGKTVEINNTDAEGRLLLADGCSYAARVLGADTVLDAATLTGAQGVATGNLHAAVVSNDEEVESALLAAGRATGDLCWPLPFAPEFYRSEFASPIADMRNSVKDRSNAQASCAAIFVHWHLDGTTVRWGHIDLAYPAFRGDRGTGFGVALLVDAVRRLGAK